MRIELLIEDINPVPWTAPIGSIARNKGKLYVQYHSDPALVAYQEGIRECILEAWPDHPKFPKDQPLFAAICFWRQLDVGTSSKSLRKIRAKRADRTNLLKAFEDALQGIFYDDDVEIIQGPIAVVEQTAETKPQITVMLTDQIHESNEDINTILEDWQFDIKWLTKPLPPGNVTYRREL